MANVIFVRGNTATINSTAITDGQLLYDTTTGQHYIDNESTRIPVGKAVDTALSTTSTNAIANNAITTSIVNTMEEVRAITADYIPCGTKPVKELNDSLQANKPIEITMTAPNIKVWTYVDLPSGYDYSNCYVVGIRVKFADADYYTICYPISVGIKNNQIGIYHEITWLIGQPIAFYISKIQE